MEFLEFMEFEYTFSPAFQHSCPASQKSIHFIGPHSYLYTY